MKYKMGEQVGNLVAGPYKMRLGIELIVLQSKLNCGWFSSREKAHVCAREYYASIRRGRK